MKYKKTILDNGLRIITVPMKDNPTVTVLVLVEVGSKYETKEISGISHFLEHLCLKGTESRPTSFDIAKEFDELGAQHNAFTGHELMGFYAKAQPRHLSKLLDIISDVYLNPTFPSEEIEKEKGVVIDEISMYEDMPQQKAGEFFMELLYGDQPVGWKILGDKKNIRNMTRNEIVKYRACHYVAGATSVIVAGGDFEEKKLLKEIEKKFTTISSGKKGKKKRTVEKQTKPNLLVKNKKTDQTHLVLGVRTFGMHSKNKAALNVLRGVLGGGRSSRLYQKLKDEMGVGYYLFASNDFFTDHGLFTVNTGVDNKRVPEVIEAILGEFRKTTEELVSEKELKKAKDYITGNIMLGLESSDSIAEYYGIQEILKKEVTEPRKFVADIRAVTSADIRAVARKIFRDERLNLALVGPFKDEKQFKKILKF
ncbi:MAG: insulinase family protein [Candidatus Pacebacteria bacterium]|nr:insulinase family protein [Candidatus Paceibacterota bacterium]